MARASTAPLSPFCRLAALAGLLAVTARAQSTGPVDWIDYVHLTASADAAWVENVSRTSYEPTRKDAATYTFDLAGSIPRQLAPSVLLVGSGEVSSLVVDNYSDAGNFTATGRLALQKKFGLGAQAWVLQASLSGGYKEARLDDDKGWTTEAGLQLSKRVLPNLRLTAGVNWLEHDAASAVFDVDQYTWAFDAHWDISEHWSLAGNASWLKGDIVANAAPTVWWTMLAGGFGPVIHDYYTSRPWSVTNLYGPGWVSYNVEADVNLWSLTLTYAWTDHASVDVHYGTAYVVNYVGVAYPSDTWGARLNYRF